MKVYYGDNQFLGINHISENKAMEQAIRFSSPKRIFSVLEKAFSFGADAFMCTTHELLQPVFDIFKGSSISDGEVIPCIPYAHKYSSLVTNKGWKGILQLVAQAGVGKLVGRGVAYTISSDTTRLMKSLVDLELASIKGLNVSKVFLQNAVTDLLLGLGLVDILVSFGEYIQNKYKMQFGFITMNYPSLVKVLIGTSCEKAWICFPYNPIGFRMNPSQTKVEEAAKERSNNIAMSILASGAVSVDQSVDYIDNSGSIDAVLFGASSTGHIRDTIQAFKNE